MRKKKVVIFLGVKRRIEDPFWSFGKKRKVYYDFFKKGLFLGFEMYLANGRQSYIEGLNFKNPLEFDGKKFIQTNKLIRADAVYDRSGGIKFPPKNISKKVLNGSDFKKLCHSKLLMYELLGNFMPRSLKIENKKTLISEVSKLNKEGKYVLKPACGLGGKGIVIDFPEKIVKCKLEKSKEYVLQEFVDTSFGIEGITSKRHDLRIVIVEEKIVWIHLRTPKSGEYLANVAQGGKIEEISLSSVPKNILVETRKIQKIIDNKYDKPVYSIDFGVERGTPFVFELNDQIGFPTDEMKSADNFIGELFRSLERIAKR